MFVILVYDTAAVRNPRVLKACRRYLHWTQRSVFQGELSRAQYRALTAALESVIDPTYDSILTYSMRSPDLVEEAILGQQLGGSGDIV